MEEDAFRAMYLGRPPVPRPCACGRTAADDCPQVGLRNHWNFPPFAYLPDENDIDLDYYRSDGGFLTPRRHWALVGEIVETVFDIRQRALVETRYGERLLVNFHLEDDFAPAFFDWSDVQIGCSVCILHPNSRTFLDLTRGIRQEASTSIMVFPATLEALTSEVEAHARASKDETSLCYYCGERETETRKLKRCVRCRVALYCNRDCQRPHWRESHKNLCPHASRLSHLARINFSEFVDFIDWSVPSEQNRNQVPRISELLYSDYRSAEYRNPAEQIYRLLDSVTPEQPHVEADGLNLVRRASCREQKQRESFSKTQLRKRNGASRCRTCVAAGAQ